MSPEYGLPFTGALVHGAPVRGADLVTLINEHRVGRIIVLPTHAQALILVPFWNHSYAHIAAPFIALKNRTDDAHIGTHTHNISTLWPRKVQKRCARDNL